MNTPEVPTWSFLVSQIGTIAALVVGGILAIIISQAAYNIFLHPLRAYPGPLLWRISRVPIDYHIFVGDTAWQILKIHERYGHVVRIGPNELSFADSRAWRDVMDHRPEFPKDSTRAGTGPSGVRSILQAYKDDHARFRRLLSHAFSEKGLREQEGRIQKYADLLVDRLREKAQSGTAADMVDWYTMVVFDVIGDLAWGEPFDGLRDRKVHEWIPAIIGNVTYLLQEAAFKRHGLTALFSILVSKQSRELLMRNYNLGVEKCRRRAELGGVQGDFWDRILIKSSNDNEVGEGMSKAEMVVNANVLVLAGAETSATTLSGTTYLLLKHPDIMQKLLHEIRTAFASSDDITVSSVNRLKYLVAVITEAMRLYPPVPNPSPRTITQGGGMVCGYSLPENTIVNVHQLSLNRSSRNFYRPLEFVPERWLESAPAEFANDDKAAHQPFSVGTRNCIGRNLAYAEMRLILAKCLYNFDLELDPRQTGDWFDQKEYGIWLKEPLNVKLSPAKSTESS